MPAARLLAPALALLILLAGCGARAEPLPPNAAAVVARARVLLPAVPVHDRAPLTGYEREEFGDGWADTDGDGCSTREDVLRRDLRRVELADGCAVASGVLPDPYSGAEIPFHRGERTSEQVQIDHVVALANAWRSGAADWSRGQRIAFANDPLGLLAVDGRLNQDKGAGDAAAWLPPNRGFRCQYVALQVIMKHRWGLWLAPAERDAVAAVLGRC